jgi:hypothetical protein
MQQPPWAPPSSLEQPQQPPHDAAQLYQPQQVQPQQAPLQQQQQQHWGYNMPFQQGPEATVSMPRHPNETVSAARQLVASMRSGAGVSINAAPPPPTEPHWLPAPQPEPEPEPQADGDYVDFTRLGATDYEPLMRTVSPPGGSGNYLGARRDDAPLMPTISALRDRMAVTLGAEMGAGAEAGAEEAGGEDTYQSKRNAIMRSMSRSPPELTEDGPGLSAWEWMDLVQVARYNKQGVRIGSQQQYLVVEGQEDGVGARLSFYKNAEARRAGRDPLRVIEAHDISSVIVSGVRVSYAQGSLRLRTAPKWLSTITNRQMMAEKVTESQELFQGLCDYIKWRAANPVDHEMVRRIKLTRRRPSRPKPEEGSAGLGLRHRRVGNVPVPPR